MHVLFNPKREVAAITATPLAHFLHMQFCTRKAGPLSELSLQCCSAALLRPYYYKRGMFSAPGDMMLLLLMATMR